MSLTINRYCYRVVLSIMLGLISADALAAPMSLSLAPAPTDVKMAFGETKNWTVIADVGACTSAPVFSIKKMPKHGTCTPHADFANNGQFSYTNNDNGVMGGMMGGMKAGMLGAAKEKIHIEAICDGKKASIKLNVSDAGASCGGASAGAGMVIFDNTAAPHLASIKTNLKLFTGCDKAKSTISTGKGGNSISIEDFHVLARDRDADPDKLMLTVGAEDSQVTDQLVSKDDKQEYFADGKHLFELNRLRSTADWLSGSTAGSPNITPDAGVASDAYGTMTMKQLLAHIAAGNTLYGMVRVKIGLQKGQRSDCGSNCTLNALGETVAASSIYGFCDASANSGLCSASECAPGKNFSAIEYGTTVCGINLPVDAKIRVKGSLLYDFVDHDTGVDVPLSALPYAPRELYFKVIVPIMVNWAYDRNLAGALPDGAMDNMLKVRAVSFAKSTGELTPAIAFADIPQESKDAYQYQIGSALTSTIFNALSYPDKYHMLMPSGYAAGWADAFDKLNITATMWGDLPPAGCLDSLGSACDKFGIPGNASGVMTTDNVRSDSFEDIPTYLYNGGLIDMHSHVNISGLIYVPQAMELETKDNGITGQSIATHQYVSGSVVIRDGFYIEANDTQPSVTVISADPLSYASAKRHPGNSTPAAFNGESGGPGTVDASSGSSSGGGSSGPDANSPCIGCAAGNGGGGGAAGAVPAGRRLWMEIRPQ